MKLTKTNAILLFSIILLALTGCKSNNYLKYHRSINEAHYHFYNNDLETAQVYFEAGIKKVPVPMEKDLLLYSVCLWNAGNQSAAIAILDTNLWTPVGLNPSHFFTDMPDSMRKEILAQNDLFYAKKMAVLESQRVYASIDSILSVDREIRIELTTCEIHIPLMKIKG